MFRLLAILGFVCLAGSALAEDATTKAASDPAARSYTEKVAAGLAAKMPESKFAVIGDFQIRQTFHDGREAIHSTFNIYPAYQADPANLSKIVDGIVASMTDKEPPGARKLVGGRIVPVIKDRPWLEEARAALKKDGGKLDLLYEDYNEQLVVVYAVDTANRTRYLMSNEDIGDRSDMRQHAVANLADLLPKVEMRRGDGVLIISAGGDYEASLLLFNSIWRSGQINVDGDIVVAIPAKDVLLVTGSRDRKGIAKLRTLAAEFFGRSRYSLTDTLFVYRDGQFVKYGRK